MFSSKRLYLIYLFLRSFFGGSGEFFRTISFFKCSPRTVYCFTSFVSEWSKQQRFPFDIYSLPMLFSDYSVQRSMRITYENGRPVFIAQSTSLIVWGVFRVAYSWCAVSDKSVSCLSSLHKTITAHSPLFSHPRTFFSVIAVKHIVAGTYLRPA